MTESFENSWDSFKRLIEKVCKEGNFSQADAKECKDLALETYKSGWRHQYGFVTKFFLNKYDEAVLSEMLQCVYANLNIVLSAINQDIQNDEEDSCFSLEPKKELVRTRRGIEKLMDHVDLEIVRLDYFRKEFARLTAQSMALNDQIKEIDKLSQNVGKEMKNQSIQSVTILGIFASIVITFVAGISLGNTMLSNLANLSNYSLGFWCILMLGGVINVLFSLYNMLFKLTKLKDSVVSPLKNWYNLGIMIFALIFLALDIFHR